MGGEMGAGARATHSSDRRTWPRSTQRTMEGSIACGCGMKNGCVCPFNCERVQEVMQAKSKEYARKGRKKRKVFGKGQRKECAPFLTWVGTCKAKEGKVFANVSAGVDREGMRYVCVARASG